MKKIGILHPGEMGVSVAVSAINSGYEVYWTSQGRSGKTRRRAEGSGLKELQSLAEVCRNCETIISVCPPAAAEEVAHSIIESGFAGLYLDANAIAPRRALGIGQKMQAGGIRFVDGGIIGGPAWTPKETWLYLSGESAEEAAACFSNGPLETKILGKEIGKASALKMCYAAYSKGTTALLSAILAAGSVLGVQQDLFTQWEMDQKGFSDQVRGRVTRASAKAWRFEGEMREIAATLQNAGLPGEFHKAAAEVFRRMSGFKDTPDTPSFDEIVQALLAK